MLAPAWNFVLTLGVLVASVATAQPQASDRTAAGTVPPADALLIRLLTPAQMLNHDELIVAGGGSAEILPAVGVGTGLGVAFGGRFREYGGEVDVSILRTWHGSRDVDGFDVTYTAIDLNWRVHGSETERLQTFLGIGGGIHNALVEDGSVGLEEVEDARFGGLSWQVGGGVTYFLTTRFAAFGEVAYRFGHYRRVEGVSDGPLQERARSRGTRAAAGLTVYFSPVADS